MRAPRVAPHEPRRTPPPRACGRARHPTRRQQAPGANKHEHQGPFATGVILDDAAVPDAPDANENKNEGDARWL